MLPTPQTSPPNGIAELSSDSVIDGRYQGKNTNDLSHEFGQMFPLPVFMREDKPTAPLGTSLAKLFQTAVELASKSEAQYRITLRRLASEGGLERLEESMDTITKASSLQAKIVLWDSQLKPCFQILTNQQAQSKALERSVQSIYSLLAGPKFDRLRSILQLVCNIAEAWVSSEDHLEITRQQELYELSSAVLRNALLAVPTNPPDAGFRELVLRFSKMFENAGTRLLSISRDRVKTDLERVLDVLSENIVPSVPGLQQNLTSYDSFTSGSDGPGHLSSQGIRHDNDHATITSIRILPTTSEIMSTRIPYIPPYDPSKWHIRGLQGLLDRHFRLLREDNLGPVRDVVRMLVGGSHASTAIYQGNTLRTNEYKLQSMRVAYDRINGFELHISTRQPSEVVKRLTSAHREQWWMETNNLDWERLICLIAQDHVMFCVVSRATCRKSTQLTETRDNSKKKRIRKYDPKRTLFGARDFAYFVLQPVDVQTKDIDFILNARLGVVGNITVVEFPTLLLASFQPTLSALQSMYASPQVPLGEYLVGNVGKHGNNNQVDEHIPPPVYAMNNFEFNLQPLLKTRSNISYAPRNEPETRELCDRTSLDEGQARALLNSLRRRLALIQGPPGTGKSYTGEAIIDVLLANKAKANLGPIICICQTNHALDQLLEHLYVGKGIKRIVRLGSQSKSSVISELTLQKIMDGQPPILHEIIVNGKRSKTRRKAAGKVIEALAELEEADPVRRQEIVRMMPKLNQEFEYYAKKVDEGWSERKTNILRGYDIIGVTTSGLARFRDLLSGVMSKVVLCEEAGEVLESHILSALMPHTQHVILIGDHEQLRPTTNVYDFQIANPDGARFSFDISLFERLVKPLLPTDKRLPFDTLQVQRRMHPRIAQLIRSTLYPQLQDADNVKQYQELSGFKNRLFWFHHTKFEDASNTARTGEFSFSNRFEIEVVKTVLGQLNRQSAYNDGEIAVLTPYAGQLRLLKIHLGTTYDISMNELDTAELEKRNMMVNVGNTKGRRRIRVATVDNFQGEEASVVIISLVRSNAARKCGFLNQSNRINVLLSRAKHGMLIIGNSDTYSPNNMWWEILQMMYAQGNVGTYFELPCPRHNGKTIRASTAQQFTLGGCTEKCDKPLACGHPCAGSCHPKIEHDKFRCRNRCDVQLSCNHMCSQACHVDRACGSCTACDPVRESESQLSDRRLKPSHAVPSEIGMPIVRIARIEVVKAEVAASGSPLHVADSLLQLGAAISSPLINFISTSHRRLVELELALLDWQDALSDTTLSAEVLGQVERTGELKIEGGPKRMIQVVHEWLGGRYDSAVGFVADVNRYLRMVRTEQTRLEAMCNPSRHSKWPETVQHEDIVQPLRLQCTLSAVVLLIRCNIVILTDFFSLRRRLNTSKTTVSIDLTGLRRLCEFVIETAQKSRYPRHEAEAHMLMGKMVAISREATGSKLAADLEELVTAKAHLARALSIIIAYERLYYLIDETEAVIGELENSTFRNIVTSKQKRKDWQLYAQDFQVDDHWHVCAYGHPFSVKKETAGPCRECDAPVGEHVSGRASSRSDDDGNADSSADCDGGEDVFHGQHSRASSLI